MSHHAHQAVEGTQEAASAVLAPDSPASPQEAAHGPLPERFHPHALMGHSCRCGWEWTRTSRNLHDAHAAHVTRAALSSFVLLASGHDQGRGECVCDLCSTTRHLVEHIDALPILPELPPLTEAQTRAYRALAGWEGRSAGAVARALGHSSPSNAARVLDRLVELGYAQTWDTVTTRERRWGAIR